MNGKPVNITWAKKKCVRISSRKMRLSVARLSYQNDRPCKLVILGRVVSNPLDVKCKSCMRHDRSSVLGTVPHVH